MKKPILNEKFADNGEHSHWELIDANTGEVLWGRIDAVLPQADVSGQVCGCCKKQLTAGMFPKWFCLRENCGNYLKPQTLR